jgi:tRNA(Ile)-lysidine synthase
MNPAFEILSALRQLAPVNSSDRFIVAISGGVDSVVLAYLCKEAGLNIELAHCNFQLRAAESDREEALVRKLAAAWKVPVTVNKVDLSGYATQQRLSIQEAARTFRYEWFASLAAGQSGKISWILTAHHADDNAETVAMHFFRGTGLAGLTGIPARQGAILRPLLSIWRNEILQLATEKELEYAEDSSNASEKYTRNYFRHTILPAVEKVYPTVKENLVHTIDRFNAIESLYQHCIDRLRGTLLIKKGNECKVSVRALQRYSGHALLHELFTSFGFSAGQLGEIQKLLKATTGAQLVAAGGSYRLIRNRNFLLLSPTRSEEASTLLVDSSEQTIRFTGGVLSFSEFSYNGQVLPTTPADAWLDAKAVVYPLVLRPWKQGDYFYPLGMRKKKKLSRFFIDQKLALSEKETTWVLESQGKILWVVGMRIDDRAKITAKTKQVISVRFSVAS